MKAIDLYATLIADAVLDSPASLTLTQADNRAHAAQAVLLHLLAGKEHQSVEQEIHQLVEMGTNH